MFGLDTTMMRSFNPSLHIAEDEVDHGQMRFCLFRITGKSQHLVTVSHIGNSIVAAPPIRADSSTLLNVVFDKAGKRFGATVGYDAKPQASRIDPTPMAPYHHPSVPEPRWHR